jgi:cell wall assembly regulator SMI1
MNYRAVFEAVKDHLDGIGVPYSHIKNKPAAARAVSRFEKRFGLGLPGPLRDFYLTFSDGTYFHWQDGESYGVFLIPSVEALGKDRKYWVQTALSPDDFPFVEDKALAKETLAGMRWWLPFDENGEGDKLCLDCGPGSGSVRYHRHDWFDGGTGANGSVMAPDLHSFLGDWSKVCFVWPTWWQATIGGKGVAWDDHDFPLKYRLGR